MVSTRSRYYRSPSPDYSESDHAPDFEPGSDTNEASEPISTLDTDRRLRVRSVDTFGDMEDDYRPMARNQFSGRAGGISLADWRLRFETWMMERADRSPLFNDWYAFKMLPHHLELDALQTYREWLRDHAELLHPVQVYWRRRMDMVNLLKESWVSLDTPFQVKPKVETEFSGEESVGEGSKGKGVATVDVDLTEEPMSRMARVLEATLARVGPPPAFEPLVRFLDHLEEEYGGFHRDQMQRIQDFRREKEDTPPSMYTRLSRLASETEDVFTDRQLVQIYLSKQEKRIVDVVRPIMLDRFGGRATLRQVLREVERIDKAMGIDDATTVALSLIESTKPKKLAVASGHLAELQPEKVVHCWACGEAGHTKGDPKCSKKKGESSGTPKAKVEVAKSGDKAGGKGKKPLTCSHCGKAGHSDENCFILHPEKRPGSSSREKTLEAEIAELKKKLSTSASLGQVADVRAPERRPCSSFAMDGYLYGAFGEVVAAVATRAQTTAQSVAPSSSSSPPIVDGVRPRHVGLPDHIGQSRLPLSFSIADTAPPVGISPPVVTPPSSSVSGEAAHSLAYKVLRLPVFSGMDFLTPNFQAASVFHLVGSMLEGKVPIPSLEVSQAVMAPPTEDELVAMRAKLAAEAILIFEADAPPTPPLQSSEDQSLISGVAYLSDIAARSARERRSVRPSVVRLVNNNGVMVVARTDGNSTRATPLRVMLDSGAQPVMIGKQLAQELGLLPSDLEPCPFTIVTSVGGTETALGYTRHPLQLMFGVGAGPLYTHVSLQCAVTGATNYDILVGQQALYPLGFGVDNWTKEAWIRPGWSAGDGRKELIPVVFAASAATPTADAMFGCSALASDLPCGSTLLEETYAFMSGVAESHEHAPVEIPARHCKDPSPTWVNPLALTRRSREIVEPLIASQSSVDPSIPILARPIQWQPPE